jgi:hypothetical protein
MGKINLSEAIDDLLPRLQDLHHQATVERSHYYCGSLLREVIALLEQVRFFIKKP